MHTHIVFLYIYSPKDVDEKVNPCHGLSNLCLSLVDLSHGLVNPCLKLKNGLRVFYIFVGFESILGALRGQYYKSL